MSWIFGYFGKLKEIEIHPPGTPIYSFKDSELTLYAGGNKQTIFSKSDSVNSKCWVVAGVGLKQSGNGYIILNDDNWHNYLKQEPVDLSSVNGHFVAVKFSNDEFRLFTDELGLREIYLAKLPGGFGFTTRIEWLKYFIVPGIDFTEFGSRWLLQNQISRNSIIKNVKRLVCGNAIIKNGVLNVEENYWQPKFEIEDGKENFDITLKKLLSFNDKKISLSLSGGLDSRLLLSYLLMKNPDSWDTHTFGDPNHPDSKIASKLLKNVGLNNLVINEDFPSAEDFIEQLKSYAIRSVVSSPISSILNLRFYDQVTGKDKIIIDGGFGEMWRREFANKYLMFGRKVLLAKNVKDTYKLFIHSKANIFSEDVLKQMEVGSITQIKRLFSELPDVELIKLENWLDLFTIRTRLLNTASSEQARIDNYVISFMPLIQKDILQLLFSFTVGERKNGKLLKDIITRNSLNLTKYPLVKGDITYPYGLSSLSARIYLKFKKKAGLYYKDRRKSEMMHLIREYILDLLRSQTVRNCELYDRKKIESLSQNFELENGEYNSEIDWFLSFELFRQGISK